MLRAGDRVAVPWQNGGGLTREVVVHPQGSNLSEFDWRVSIAEVRRSGPFSSFPGVDRQMAVLDGHLTLTIEGGETLSLSPDSLPASFAGENRVLAHPVGPVVTDLNVMTRRGRFRARLARRVISAAEQLTLKANSTLLIALSELTLCSQATRGELSVFDAVLFAGAARCEVLPPAAGAAVSFYLAEISAAAQP